MFSYPWSGHRTNVVASRCFHELTESRDCAPCADFAVTIYSIRCIIATGYSFIILITSETRVGIVMSITWQLAIIGYAALPPPFSHGSNIHVSRICSRKSLDEKWTPG